MIDSNKMPATYANIVPATPKSRHPRNAIATLFHVLSAVNEHTMKMIVYKIKWNGMAYHRLVALMLLNQMNQFRFVVCAKGVKSDSNAMAFSRFPFILTKQSQIESHKKKSTFYAQLNLKLGFTLI